VDSSAADPGGTIRFAKGRHLFRDTQGLQYAHDLVVHADGARRVPNLVGRVDRNRVYPRLCQQIGGNGTDRPQTNDRDLKTPGLFKYRGSLPSHRGRDVVLKACPKLLRDGYGAQRCGVNEYAGKPPFPAATACAALHAADHPEED
jgi:hypothetical protein